MKSDWLTHAYVTNSGEEAKKIQTELSVQYVCTACLCFVWVASGISWFGWCLKSCCHNHFQVTGGEIKRCMPYIMAYSLKRNQSPGINDATIGTKITRVIRIQIKIMIFFFLASLCNFKAFLVSSVPALTYSTAFPTWNSMRSIISPWDSTRFAMSTNISCNSKMDCSSFLMSACLASMSARVCFICAVSVTICVKRMINKFKSLSLYKLSL